MNGRSVSASVARERRSSTLTEAVIESVCGLIRRRDFEPGGRLPSIRQLARQLGVSKATVEEAYARLAADAVIEAVERKGFYVPRQDAGPETGWPAISMER